MQFPVVTMTLPVSSTVVGSGAGGAPGGAGSVVVSGPGWEVVGGGADRALTVVAMPVTAFEHRLAREQACTATR